MVLTEQDLKAVPALYSQEHEDDPIIYAKLVAPDQNWACYIAEAGLKNGQSYEVFGLFVGKHGHHWGQLPLILIVQDLQETGTNANLDRSFKPNRSSLITGIKRRGAISV